MVAGVTSGNRGTRSNRGNNGNGGNRGNYEHFSLNLKFYESDSFSGSSLHRIFDSENFRFPFSTKNGQIWGVKWEKLNFRKS